MKQDDFCNSAYKSTNSAFAKSNSGGFKVDKKFKEDEKKTNSLNTKISPNLNNVEEQKKRIGKKAIRKIIRLLNEEISPEEIQLMI